jgi:uncharacterized membrane protein
MGQVAIALTASVGLFMAVLSALVAYKMLTGEINTVGLLSDKQTHEFSPARLQLLIATLFAGGYWFLKVLEPGTTQVPDVPQDLLLLFGGSHTLYLGSKSLPLLLRQLQ